VFAGTNFIIFYRTHTTGWPPISLNIELNFAKVQLQRVNFVKPNFLTKHDLLRSTTATKQAREVQTRYWSHHMLKGRAGILSGDIETVEDRQ
jgi:hypothetical protein